MTDLWVTWCNMTVVKSEAKRVARAQQAATIPADFCRASDLEQRNAALEGPSSEGQGNKTEKKGNALPGVSSGEKI